MNFDEAIKTVQAILKRGNDAEIRRKGDGYIVTEYNKVWNAAQLLAAVNAVLAKGDRVELIPVKDGVKVIHIKRTEVKLNNER